jgi:hypothetical protein
MSKEDIVSFESQLKAHEIVDAGQYLMTTSRRTAFVFPKGTSVYDTQTDKLYLGDNSTVGGVNTEGGVVEYAQEAGGLIGASENVSVVIDDIGDDRGVHVYGGELSVGTPGDPRESVFGGGDSYPAPVSYHCTEANTTGLTITSAIDVTNIFKSDTGSTAGLFNGTVDGNYILVGSDYPYLGVKMKMADGGDVNPENARLEAWIADGVYNTVQYMVTNANYPYAAEANAIGTNLNEQWRFGFDPFEESLWDPVTLNINGTDVTKYWGRMVIQNGGIVADPVVEQIKCHSDRFEVNATGVTEYFGRARYPRTLQAGLQIATPNSQIDPTNENVAYGTLTTAKYVDNEFQSNRDDGFLVIQGIEAGLDTSIPLVVSLSYYVKGITTGDVVFDVDVFQVTDGFVYDGANPSESYSVTDTVAVSSSLIRRTSTVEVDAEKVKPGEALVISIRRNGASNPLDTVGDSVVLTYASVTGWFWR